MYTGTDNTTLITEYLAPIPDMPNAFFRSPALDGPLVDASGNTFFKSGITDSSGTFTGNNGIFVHDGATAQTLVADGLAVADRPDVEFDGIYPFDLAINSRGQFAFASGLSGVSVTADNNLGLFRGHVDGSIDTILRRGDKAPGMPAEVQFDSFRSPEMNRDGQLAFLADIRGPGISRLNDETVWAQDTDGTFVLVAREGDAAPEAPAYVFFGDPSSQFQAFRELVINAQGQVAFHTRLSGSGLGHTSGNLNDDGVWATDTDGTLRSIVIAGQPFDTMNGDSRSHGTISFAGDTGNDEGLATGFSDAGHVSFHGYFGNAPAIYVSSKVVSIPEPGTACLLMIAAGIVLLCRRLRGHHR